MSDVFHDTFVEMIKKYGLGSHLVPTELMFLHNGLVNKSNKDIGFGKPGFKITSNL